MARRAASREIRLAGSAVAALAWRGGQIRIATRLTQVMDVPRQVRQFSRREVVARHRGLQIRPARANDGAEQLAVLVGANERTAKQVACAHHGATEIRSVTEVTMIQNVDRTASL